jgi:hypothetical protein
MSGRLVGGDALPQVAERHLFCKIEKRPSVDKAGYGSQPIAFWEERLR